MKKFLSFALSLVLLLAVMPLGAVSAYTEPTIVVSEVSGTPGETVDVVISLENNPGIISMRLEISYDSDTLELVGKKAGNSFMGMAFSQRYTANPYIANWVDSLNPDNTTCGTFVTLTFKIKEDSLEGMAPVTVDYVPDDVYNFAWDNVDFAVADGGVDVVYCRHVSTRTVKEDYFDATCIEKGGYSNVVYCNDCGAKVSSTTEYNTAATGHNFELIAAAESSCNMMGNIAYKHCKNCNKNYPANATATTTWELALADEEIYLPYRHQFNNDNRCELCGVYKFTKPTVYANDVMGLAGDEVEVVVALQNNPGIISLKLAIGYDSEVLELVGKTAGEAYSVMSYSQMLTINPYIVNWVDSIHPNNTTDGIFVTLTFKIKDNAAVGSYPITITYDQVDSFNSDYDDVWFDIKNGEVQVIDCTHENTTTQTRNHRPATCTSTGSYLAVEICDNCGIEVSENTVTVPMLDHTAGSAVSENHIESTCTVKGSYESVIFCVNCNKELTRETVILELVPHTPGETITTNFVDPTCQAKGSYDEVVLCADCDAEVSRVTVTTVYGHKLDVSGKCSECKTTVAQPMFFVTSGKAIKGKTFTVDVVVKNNPGIVSTKLAIEYDETKFELVSHTGNGIFSPVSFGPADSEPFYINWVDTINPNNTSDGVIATITFKAKEDAEIGESVITINYDGADVYNSDFTDVAFDLNYATIEVKDYTPGDVNDDGVVNNKDLGMVMQYLNSWKVGINLDAADVNADGAVNNKDYGILMQYLNGWKVELK